MKAPSIDVSDAAHTMTMSVTVHGRRRFRIRLAIGCALFRFGAWVIGMGRVEITVTPP